MAYKNEIAKILIVDDCLTLLNSISIVLKRAGYEIHSASTYKQATTALSENQFALVLTDINLGDHSGIELIPVIQSLQHIPELIFMTGNTKNLCQSELNPYTVLIKPFRVGELMRVIDRPFLKIQNT